VYYSSFEEMIKKKHKICHKTQTPLSPLSPLPINIIIFLLLYRFEFTVNIIKSHCALMGMTNNTTF